MVTETKSNGQMIDNFLRDIKNLAAKVTADNKFIKGLPKKQEDNEHIELIENSQDLIGELSLDCRYLSVSSSCWEMLGYDRKELIGRRFFELLYPEDIPVFMEKCKGMFLSFPFTTMPVRLKHKNGEWHWFEILLKLYLNGSSLQLLLAARKLPLSQPYYYFNLLNRHIADLLDSINEALCSLDRQWRLTYVNQQAERLFKKPRHELIGKKLCDVIPLGLSFNINNELKEVLLEKKFICFEKYYRPINKWYEIKIYSFSQGLAVFFNDISERKQSEEKIKHFAYHDPLTNIPNRVLLKNRLDNEINRARRSNNLLCVMFLDLDKFKIINDTLGHEMGDRMLVSVARRLAGCLREGDTVARLGGDEFIILLPEIENVSKVKNVVHRIINRLKKPFAFDGQEFYITSSIGVAIYPTDGTDAETLIKNADKAMYYAKKRGRNSYQFYKPFMNSCEDVLKKKNLHQALENKEFIVHYQPVFNVSTGQIIGTEAVVRWQHPDLGLVYPEKFLPLAEKTGLIIPLGEWVLEKACHQCKSWHNQGWSCISVAVNMSAREFYQDDLVQQIAGILERTGLKPQFLQLEITENTLLQDPELAVTILHSLKKMGIKISLDDFGDGYTSFNHLKRIPVDIIKIDKSFIQEIDSDPVNNSIVKAMIKFGKIMQKDIVAEGVETGGQRDFLTQEKCEIMQGYLFSKPVAANQLEECLKM
ncbi:MAG: EAL domain-containing protein [Desulfotomaculum sp.]|nr:EAL domain-containing protein [Desulfotomaculum sp.]